MASVSVRAAPSAAGEAVGLPFWLAAALAPGDVGKGLAVWPGGVIPPGVVCPEGKVCPPGTGVLPGAACDTRSKGAVSENAASALAVRVFRVIIRIVNRVQANGCICLSLVQLAQTQE